MDGNDVPVDPSLVKPHGSFPEKISPARDLIDFLLTRVPRLYLEVERLRRWINWDKRIYLTLIKRGDTVLDVGANTGRHTVMFSHLVGSSGRVMAFEPVPANVARLKENVRARSRFSNVDIIQLALGNPGAEREDAVIVAPGEDLTQASLKVQTDGSWLKTTDLIEYPCSLSSVDAEISRSSAIDFLKIDVEGGELDVLKGAVTTLAKHQPLIYAEVDQRWMSSFGHTVAELFAFVRSLGYDGARVIDENGVHDVSESNPKGDTFPPSANVLFFSARHVKLVESFDKHNRVEAPR